MRAHTVILGAGATVATIPNGDKHGKKYLRGGFHHGGG